jgi:hypothetical protein
VVTATARAPHALLALAVIAGLGTALFGEPRAARAGDAEAPAAAPVQAKQVAPSGGPVHGLSPLPGGAPVPEEDRPPGSFADDGGPSPAIFPPQKITIRFNHKKHVAELGLSCTTCHTQARTSRKASESMLPKPTRCDACHGSDHRDLGAVAPDPTDLIGQCGFCHLGWRPEHGNRVERMLFPAPNLRFDHARHLARNIGCQRCHGAVENLELATRDQLPRMNGCFGCHQMPVAARGEARGECTTCHLTEPRGGTLKTSFASGELRPPRWLHDADHGPDWIERHKRVAAADSQFCASCHTESYCTDCHDGRVNPRKVHPNDWISMHPIAARQGNPTCTSCHQQQSFCIGCHQRAGVTLTGPYQNFERRGRFHPPRSEWTEQPRGASHHAWEAERNINACVSCHVERDCAICHATAARGGRGSLESGSLGQGSNPHPGDFLGRCATALRKNARPCLFCHDPADPKLDGCR